MKTIKRIVIGIIVEGRREYFFKKIVLGQPVTLISGPIEAATLFSDPSEIEELFCKFDLKSQKPFLEIIEVKYSSQSVIETDKQKYELFSEFYASLATKEDN